MIHFIMKSIDERDVFFIEYDDTIRNFKDHFNLSVFVNLFVSKEKKELRTKIFI